MARRCPTCGTSYADDIAFCGQDGTITVQELGPGDEPDSRLGQRYGNYIVVARVADGAMGRVYEGRHAETKEKVAVKVLHSNVATDPVSVERFKREYETAQSMPHPGIVKVIDFGETTDGSWFLTMEYLKGEELGNILRRDGGLEGARIVRVLCQVALALDHAHSFGVIHRDLKPDNIFLCEGADGDVARVLDFGSVKLQVEMGPKLTAFGTTLGSPYYMSPEQAMGKHDVDHRTDVFALGAILYEMITGRVAFEGDTVATIIMAIMNGTPTPPTQLRPGIPPALDDVFEKSVRKDKNRRYSSAGELAQAALRAFGLEGSVADWAAKSPAEIQAALGAAVPPPARPFGTQSSPPPGKGAAGAKQPAAAGQAKPSPGGAAKASNAPGGRAAPIGPPAAAPAPDPASDPPAGKSGGPPMMLIVAAAGFLGVVVLGALAFFLLR